MPVIDSGPSIHNSHSRFRSKSKQQLCIGEIYTFVQQQTTRLRKKIIDKVHQDFRIIQTEKKRLLAYEIGKPEIIVEKQERKDMEGLQIGL